MRRPKVLVVYYSRSGTTRTLASAIAKSLGSDIEEIVEPRDRNGFIGYIRSLIETARRQPSAIEPSREDPSAYDLVIIGSPVWAGSIPAPVRSYLAANKARLPEVAFFCTLSGRGSESMFAQMQILLGKSPQASLAVTARKVMLGDDALSIAEFIERLGVLAPVQDDAATTPAPTDQAASGPSSQATAAQT